MYEKIMFWDMSLAELLVLKSILNSSYSFEVYTEFRSKEDLHLP